MDKKDVTSFIRSGQEGDSGWFEAIDHGRIQMAAHAACQNPVNGEQRKVKCQTFLAVSGRLDETVRLTRVRILR